VITNAAKELVYNAEDRMELVAISWHLKVLSDWMKKWRGRCEASMIAGESIDIPR